MTVLKKGFLIGFVIIFTLVLSQTTEKAQAETAERFCYPSTETIRLGTDFISQTFVSPFDVIRKIEFYGRNDGADVLLNLELRGSDGSLIENDSSLVASLNNGEFYFWPSNPVEVSKTDTLTIWISNNLNDDNQFYIWKGANSSGDCNPEGTAFRNFTNLHHDLAMVIYGYDYVSGEVVGSEPGLEPVGEAATSEENETSTETDSTASDQATSSSSSESESTAQEDSSSSTEEAGDNEVAKASNAPSNVAAEYNEESGVVKVSWEASNMEDVDGYEVYRAESSERAFIKVAEVDGETYTYEDNAIEPGEYHYYVVAISENQKSDTSDVAKVTVGEDGSSVTATTEGGDDKSVWQKISDYIANNTWASMALGALLVLLAGLLYYLIRKRRQLSTK